jgi:hypothetical protein
MRRNSRILLLALLTALLLGACGNNANFYITKYWGDWQVRLETRPHPIEVGHDEFLLHIIGPQNRLPTGMIVRYRMGPQDTWIQAMPDGLSDVFRRSEIVKDPAHAKLYVHLQLGDKQGQLVFDLGKTLAQHP